MFPQFDQPLQSFRIGVFVPCLSMGGAQRVALNLTQGLADQGFNVDLVLQKAVGAFLKQVDSRVRIVDLKTSGIIGRIYGLVQYFQREQPAVFLSILDNVNAASLAKHIAGVSTRVIVSLHINLPEPVENLKTWLKPFLIRYSYPLADGVVAVSHGVAENISCITGMPSHQIHIIPNPIIPPDDVEEISTHIAHPWFKPGEPPVILGAGRLVKDKDFATLIRAFAIVRQQQDSRLMILGEGDQRPALQALIQQLGIEAFVALPGFVEDPYPYMAAASVFVLSSLKEAFGNVLVEAMAVKTPVVSTNCMSGPRDILEAGRYGKLVAVANPPQLAEAISSTLCNPPDVEALKERSKAFSIEQVVNQYIQVLEISMQSKVTEPLVDLERII